MNRQDLKKIKVLTGFSNQNGKFKNCYTYKDIETCKNCVVCDGFCRNIHHDVIFKLEVNQSPDSRDFVTFIHEYNDGTVTYEKCEIVNSFIKE